MNDENPYAPPAAYSDLPQPEATGYVPLGWRTLLVTLALGGRVVLGAVINANEGALDDPGKAPGVAAALALAAAGLGLVVSVIGAVVFFLMWIHRAHKNLPALGRQGMHFTPGTCVGWFFVPIANLWKPVQAVAEIWRASDPDGQDYWRANASTPWIGVWWGTWLVGNALENASSVGHAKSSGVDLVATAFSAVAAVALVVVMRGIDRRQGARAARLAREGGGDGYGVTIGS
jgi:hypothetical protein